jgi:hypothetical protein
MYYGNADVTSDPSTTAVWDANYVAVYHMNDVTTSTIKDSTVNANNGTKKGANEPVQVDGKIGKGQDFDETHTEYINCGTNVKLGTTTPYTVQSWVKFTSDINEETFFLGKKGYHWGFTIYTSTIKRFRFDTYDNTNTFKTTYTSTTINPDTWYLLTATFGADGYNTLYLNGVYARNVYVGTNRNYNDTTLYLGKVLALYIDGAIDEPRFSNIARSVDWIKTEYANQNSPSTFVTFGSAEILGDGAFVKGRRATGTFILSTTTQCIEDMALRTSDGAVAGFVLVNTSDPKASPIRIKTGTAIRALREVD